MREDVPAKAIKATKLGIFEEQGRCVESFGPKLDLIFRNSQFLDKNLCSQ